MQFLFPFFWDKASLCPHGWPWSYYVAVGDPELIYLFIVFCFALPSVRTEVEKRLNQDKGRLISQSDQGHGWQARATVPVCPGWVDTRASCVHARQALYQLNLPPAPLPLQLRSCLGSCWKTNKESLLHKRLNTGTDVNETEHSTRSRLSSMG